MSTNKYFARFLWIVLFCKCDESQGRNPINEDTSFWLSRAQDHLVKVLSHKDIEKRAKNVIVFLGDGMGMASITAGRIYKGQTKGQSGEEYKLAFENFPNTGFSKTYNVDKQVPDSAGTATALFTGVKSRYRTLGFDVGAEYDKCNETANNISKLSSLASWAQATGIDTGFVTTTRVTHATPGALYAHINNRDWECDSAIPKYYRSCTKDIGSQLVEDLPGRNFKVIMGGGGKIMGIPGIDDPSTCGRMDGKNLTKTWEKNNPTGKIVTNLDQLMSVDILNTTRILGIFASGHLPYQLVKPENTPSLANMTMQAIRLLRKNKRGFFLMVEGGKIDIAHHQNYAKLALSELADFDDAIRIATQMVEIEETLIIVTADHSHAFTFNGYPNRGNDIFGFANQSKDVLPYETLSYANGPGFNYHRLNDSRQNVFDTWRAVEKDENRDNPFYQFLASRPLVDETHGGEDVGVYAIGPYSHLFRGTFEQNYVAHVIAYAACYQNWPSHCDGNYKYTYEISASSHLRSSYSLSTIAIVIFLFINRMR